MVIKCSQGACYNTNRPPKIPIKQADLNEKMLLELTQAANNFDEVKLEAALADRSLEQADENHRISKGEFEARLEPLSDHLEAQNIAIPCLAGLQIGNGQTDVVQLSALDHNKILLHF